MDISWYEYASMYEFFLILEVAYVYHCGSFNNSSFRDYNTGKSLSSLLSQ